jgi:hypothetical protein
MKQLKRVTNLAWGEFIVPDQSQNTEIAGALDAHGGGLAGLAPFL